jgi:hypothetical protein
MPVWPSSQLLRVASCPARSAWPMQQLRDSGLVPIKRADDYKIKVIVSGAILEIGISTRRTAASRSLSRMSNNARFARRDTSRTGYGSFT